jgi:hypothetical protein
MLKVYLFRLGYVGGVDFRRIANLVNRSQNVIEVTVGDAVPNIGDPDLYDIAYSRTHLCNLFPSIPGMDLRVGVTMAPLEGNFYTLTHDIDMIIITLFQTDEVSERAGRTMEEYIAQTMATELLWLQYKAQKPGSHFSDLFHQDTRGCIFDFVTAKPEKVHKLRSGRIDPMCQGKLVEANVPGSVVRAVGQIIERIQKPSLLESLAQGLQRPLFSLVFGSLVGGLAINTLSSLALGDFDSISDYYVVGFLVLLIVGLAIGNYIRTLRNSSRLD